MRSEFTWGRERFCRKAGHWPRWHRAPAIVRVFDYLEANGTAYIVMELLIGETLEIASSATTRLARPRSIKSLAAA